MKRLWNRSSEVILDVAAIGFTSLGFLLVWGRAVNSPLSFRLERLPIIGWIPKALRGATNQGYDVTGDN